MSREKRWVVGPGGGESAAEVVRRLGEEPAAAVAEGRVFVGRRRVLDPGERLASGDVLCVYGRRGGAAAGGVELLGDDEGVVAALKPAELSTIADHHGRAAALHDRLARALGVPAKALHPTSRLDVGVSGVVLFARDDEARRRLARARDEGAYRRRYVALASGALAADRALWDAPIGRGPDPRRRYARGNDAAGASTEALALGRAGERATLLGLVPRTGRTHQLRVHAADAGHPLFGDALYGGPRRLVKASGEVLELGRVALHALSVTVPGRGGEPRRYVAPLPAEFGAWWAALGGDGAAVERLREGGEADW
ncbi:MAG TPA: RluA family pseudouridine synthase [Polyangiaceae bacterium]|nr:RluA family pseudouridine synthase [Polyangiaceae bacterium]